MRFFTILALLFLSISQMLAGDPTTARIKLMVAGKPATAKTAAITYGFNPQSTSVYFGYKADMLTGDNATLNTIKDICGGYGGSIVFRGSEPNRKITLLEGKAVNYTAVGYVQINDLRLPATANIVAVKKGNSYQVTTSMQLDLAKHPSTQLKATQLKTGTIATITSSFTRNI